MKISSFFTETAIIKHLQYKSPQDGQLISYEAKKKQLILIKSECNNAK